MADLAMVFHWSLAELDDLDVDELVRWHQVMVSRSEQAAQAARRRQGQGT